MHTTHSPRIDFFLLDNNLLDCVNACEYHPIAISDHAPTTVDISLPQDTIPRALWRFSSYLLSDNNFKDFVAAQIRFYIDFNDTPDVSSSILWEALKATTRGHVISYISQMRRAERARLVEIADEFLKLDETYSTSPSPILYKKRLLLHSEHDQLMTRVVERQLRQSKQNFFEQGDKAGRLLAQQARAVSASRLIYQIKLPDGSHTSDPVVINKSFSDFYSTLYTSECTPITETTPNPLDRLTFPQIDVNIARELGRPISSLEVHKAINSMQNRKSPGPDGFTVEFFKAYSMLLVPILVRMFNDSFTEGRLPATLYEASISLLLKKDRDPTSCGNYRPVSLLNVDCKILAKVLALRLQNVMSSIISLDQTGFTLGRHSFFNTRRLLNILSSPAPNTPEVVVALDAEKAFDRVEWGFLFSVLEKFGFDSNFISWVKLLYATPSASVNTNGVHSAYFPLKRGTRQGCPLSPLLFNIAIEPLAIWLRNQDEFEGITRFGQVHKLSLYADDLLLFISNPTSSLTSVLSILDQFGRLSGYKLNIQKSELFFVNNLARSLPQSIFPFKIAEEGFRYLGVFITSSFRELYLKNFQPLLDKCKSDLSRWAALPLSLAGRVNLIKMVILPKFLYLFQHIPICLNKSFFANLDQQFNAFIWHNKPARIKKHILQLSKSEGGLALPNFRHYFWACNINKLLYWLHDKSVDACPPWAHTEISSSSCSLHSMICSQLPISAHKVSTNPVVTNTIKIWTQFRKQHGLHRASVLAPVSKNYAFLPSCSDPTFCMWSNKGLRTLNDLYDEGVFMSFAALSEKYSFPNSHFFRYLQMRHFIQKQFPHFPNRPPEAEIDQFLSLNLQQKRLISVIHNKIALLSPAPTASPKNAWEKDLGVDITVVQWKDILKLIHSSSICARHGLLQWKVLHRAHFTNAKLAKIYSSHSDACNRCKQSPADHAHMFWTCPGLTDFWSDIFQTLKQALNISLEPNPLTALFGLPPTKNFPNTTQRVMAFTTLLARRTILLKWKHVSPPTHNSWIREILQCLQLEKLRFSQKGSLTAFHKTWDPLIAYISNSVTVTPDDAENAS
uniref:Reverse transcriptase domain-containing protein n=1 Tax=Sparus aurata TaxID=8175 RepID=A0A671TVY8_SPAAU